MNTATRNLSQLITNATYQIWPPIEHFSLQEHEVHFWLILLPKYVSSARFEELHQLKQERRLILIDILKHYTQKPFQILENPHGKPFIKDHALEFSTSHSGTYLAIAISKKPIGVDIEKYRARHFLQFSKGFFEDKCPLEQIPPFLHGHYFYQQWVKTEALVKYQGQTIFNFTELDDNQQHTLIFEPKVGLMAAMMQKKAFESMKKQELDWQDQNIYWQVISALHENDLKERLHDQTLKLHRFDTLDSTQQYLKNLPFSPYMEICQSDFQTHGRGRFGRTWVSPKGLNLYFSIRRTLNCSAHQLEGLSLSIGLSIVKILEERTGIKAQLKWPNDIYIQGKKLAGILIELVHTQSKQSTVLIGIGLNVNAKTSALPEMATSLFEITQKSFDKMDLLKHLMVMIQQHISKFEQNGFEAFIKDWQNYDLLYLQKITVKQGHQSIQGIAQGVNEKGYLILQDLKGKLHEVGSGETSIQSFTNK